MRGQNFSIRKIPFAGPCDLFALSFSLIVKTAFLK